MAKNLAMRQAHPESRRRRVAANFWESGALSSFRLKR
jgi:hypothetical protein